MPARRARGAAVTERTPPGTGTTILHRIPGRLAPSVPRAAAPSRWRAASRQNVSTLRPAQAIAGRAPLPIGGTSANPAFFEA